MNLQHFRRLERVLRRLFHRVKRLRNGLLGIDRRETQRLVQRLSALRAEHNVLKRDMAELSCQASRESQGLMALYEKTKVERDDLQLQVWELEQLVEELLELLPPSEALDTDIKPEAAAETSLEFLNQIRFDSPEGPAAGASTAAETVNDTSETVELSQLKLALVGGHDSTRRGVISELSQRYGLRKWVELPPFSKHSLGRNNVKAKICDCDLIVLITGYMKHKQTDHIVQLHNAGALSGDVLMLTCRGKSGVVREILAHVGRKDC